ncbi:MAG: hypothetical protein BWK78_03245 [Thiotrichaceae bacterium IS1]|nr:MAG: hypothetical protein BWK78_03245 [Thiotrichaceae bacterium IS1]
MNSTSHSIICQAPAHKIYEIISDVQRWVGLFEVTREVTIVGQGDNHQLARISATINGVETTWITHRKFRPEIYGVDFEILTPMPLVQTMHGQWRVIPLESGGCLALVEHHFTIKADVTGLAEGVQTRQEALDYMLRAIHNNAWQDLERIKVFVERDSSNTNPLTYTFSTDKVIAAPIAEVYHFLKEVANWPSRLPHCQAVEMRYEAEGRQEFIMEVSTPQGKERFRSIRICHDQTFSIDYFQLEPPAVLKFHGGSWNLHSVKEGTKVTIRRQIVINPEACLQLFGKGSIADYQKQIAAAIEKNSVATLEAAEKHWSKTLTVKN